MTTSVSEYVSTPVLTVDAATTLVEAAAAMTAEGMHSPEVISEDCRLEGVFTSTDPMAAAAAVMREADVSHLPVTDEQVRGILTRTDLATHLAQRRETATQ